MQTSAHARLQRFKRNKLGLLKRVNVQESLVFASGYCVAIEWLLGGY